MNHAISNHFGKFGGVFFVLRIKIHQNNVNLNIFCKVVIGDHFTITRQIGEPEWATITHDHDHCFKVCQKYTNWCFSFEKSLWAGCNNYSFCVNNNSKCKYLSSFDICGRWVTFCFSIIIIIKILLFTRKKNHP